MKGQGHAVDAVGVFGRDNGVELHVAKEGYFFLMVFADCAVGAAYEDVGLDTDLAKLLYGVLRGLGLKLPARSDVGEQRQVHVEDVFLAEVEPYLPYSLKKGEALNVADRAAYLNDGYIDAAREAFDVMLYLVGYVRDDLHGAAEVVAPAFLFNYGVVNLARGVVVIEIGGTVGDIESLPFLQSLYRRG